MATSKQKLAAEKIIALKLKNPCGKGLKKKAMIAAGYKPSTAHNPKKNLTSTKGFQEAIEKKMPDDMIIDKHLELFEAKKVISANIYANGKDGKPVNNFIEVPDNQTQGKMVELAYKVKGKMPTGNVAVQVNNIIGQKRNEYGI